MNGKVSISADRKKRKENLFTIRTKVPGKNRKENEIKKKEKSNSMSLIEGFQLRVKRVNVVDSPFVPSLFSFCYDTTYPCVPFGLMLRMV